MGSVSISMRFVNEVKSVTTVYTFYGLSMTVLRKQFHIKCQIETAIIIQPIS